MDVADGAYALIERNVFEENRDAILFGDNISNPIDVRPNNQFGVNPLSALGSCDFFGDGQQDQFMATGVTWWAQSPTTQQWRYLNTMSATLPQPDLRKVDGDAICDVALKGSSAGLVSKSGTGPWVPSK